MGPNKPSVKSRLRAGVLVDVRSLAESDIARWSVNCEWPLTRPEADIALLFSAMAQRPLPVPGSSARRFDPATSEAAPLTAGSGNSR
jgi:hypothetical protein